MATVKTNFTEVQKFRQWWFWIILAMIFLSPFIIKFNSILENGFWGTFSMGILAHITSLGLLLILMAIIQVKTQVNEAGIRLEYFPIFKKNFSWDEINSAELIQFDAQQIRGRNGEFWKHYGSIRRMKNNHGILVQLKNGKNYLISTQKPAELKEALLLYK